MHHQVSWIDNLSDMIRNYSFYLHRIMKGIYAHGTSLLPLLLFAENFFQFSYNVKQRTKELE